MTAVDLAAVSQAIVDALEGDENLVALREQLRGGAPNGPGLTERRVFPPRTRNDRFVVPEAEAPYFCVCSREGDLLAPDGFSATSLVEYSRAILCVNRTGRPTYEADAELKELFEATIQVLAGEALLDSLQTLGATHLSIVQLFLDGLQSGDQGFFVIEIAPQFPGVNL